MASAWPVRIALMCATFAYVLHAAYFDWSDVGLHLGVALVGGAIGVKWPRLATVALMVLLGLLALAHQLFTVPAWAQAITEGMSLKQVIADLGPPSVEAPSFGEARALTTGYGVPSPIRFRHDGPVSVFTNGEHALWVFHSGDRVVMTHVTGT